MLQRLRPLHLALFAILWQGLNVWAGWQNNPFLQHPIEDAAVYWSWADHIASGNWVGETPLLSAPLYPWLLGLLRFLGLGIPGVLVFQTLLHGATVWLISKTGSLRFGPKDGILAGLIYIFLSEPAFFGTRLLNPSLVLFSVALLLWATTRLTQTDSPSRQTTAFWGFSLGLATLANPTTLLLIPIFGVWLLKRSGIKALIPAATVCLILVSTATIHNYLATSRAGHAEFIPISAQAGITYSHGNAPGATGIYHPIPGVSASRHNQNEGAFELAARKTGERSWSSASNYFFKQGLQHLLLNPSDALLLHARKLLWFVASTDYGDLYQPALEAADADFGSVSSTLRNPIPSVLLVWFALPAAWLLWRRQRSRALPEILLILLPLFVVLVFWFSPRYRIPILPVAALCFPWTWSVLNQKQKVLAFLPLLAGLVIPFFFRADDPSPFRPQYEHSVGSALRILAQDDLDQLQRAESRLRNAVLWGYDNANSRFDLAQAIMAQAQLQPNRWPDALQGFQEVLKHNPKHKQALLNRNAIQQWLLEEKRSADSELESKPE